MKSIGFDRKIVSKNELDSFMQSSLVVWVRSLPNLGTTSLESFDDFTQGVFLMEVASAIDYSFFAPYLNRINDHDIEQEGVQVRNNKILLEAIVAFYKEKLNALLLLEEPIIASICRKPLQDVGLKSIQQFLVLLLEVSLKCANGEKNLEYLQSLDHSAVIEIFNHAKVYHTGKLVLLDSTDMDEKIKQGYDESVNCVATLLLDRNDLAIGLDSSLAQLEEEARADAESKDASQVSSSRLRDLEQQVNLLSEDLDHRSSQYDELKEELKSSRIENSELRERVDLLLRFEEDAKRLYDEVDTWKYKALANNTAAQELEKAKEQLVDQNYFKQRIQELEERVELHKAWREKSTISSEANQEHLKLLASKESDIRSLTEQTKQLFQAQDNWFKQKREMTTQALRAESKITEQQAKIADLQTQLNKFQQQGDTMASQQEEAMKQLRDEIEKLKFESMHQDNSKEEIEQLKSEAASFEKLNNELLEDMHTKSDELRQANIRLIDLEQEIDTLRKRIHSLTEINTSTASGHHSRLHSEDTNEDILQQLEDAFKKSSKVKDDRISVLTERLKDVSSHIAELQKELSASKLREEELVADINFENSPLTKRKSISVDKLSTTQEPQEDTSVMTQKEKARSDEIEKKYSNLKQRYKQQNRELKKFQSDRLRLKDDIRSLKREKARIEKENNKLNNQIESVLSQQSQMLFQSQQQKYQQYPVPTQQPDDLVANDYSSSKDDVQHVTASLASDLTITVQDDLSRNSSFAEDSDDGESNEKDSVTSTPDATSDGKKKKSSYLQKIFKRTKSKDPTSSPNTSSSDPRGRSFTIGGILKRESRHARTHSNEIYTKQKQIEEDSYAQFQDKNVQLPASTAIKTNLLSSKHQQHRRPHTADTFKLPIELVVDSFPEKGSHTSHSQSDIHLFSPQLRPKHRTSTGYSHVLNSSAVLLSNGDAEKNIETIGKAFQNPYSFDTDSNSSPQRMKSPKQKHRVRNADFSAPLGSSYQKPRRNTISLATSSPRVSQEFSPLDDFVPRSQTPKKDAKRHGKEKKNAIAATTEWKDVLDNL